MLPLYLKKICIFLSHWPQILLEFKTQLLNGQEGTLQTDMHITKQAGKWNQIFMRQIWLKQMVVFLCFSHHAAFEMIFHEIYKIYVHVYYKIMIWDLRMWFFFIMYLPVFFLFKKDRITKQLINENHNVHNWHWIMKQFLFLY